MYIYPGTVRLPNDEARFREIPLHVNTAKLFCKRIRVVTRNLKYQLDRTNGIFTLTMTVT